MAIYRYYLPFRPPMPGTVPNSSRVAAVEDFGGKKSVPGVGEAWGYVEYEQQLTDEQIKSYELIEERSPFTVMFPDGSRYMIYTTGENARQIAEKGKLIILPGNGVD